ncbi:hypothetical protein ILUMI_10703 [Ignelater luminosus]|uniref:VWFA domain-containing protein n=1 Tax=Ignelater luminosus TaxID=2038154 RepID=A0A8K0D1W7_IGNLU|nr:hypothetical protein ILUMI_10703 [Ignelater luminosus]
MEDNLLSLYKFMDFSSFKSFNLNLMKYRRAELNCSEHLYVLPEDIKEISMRRFNFISKDKSSCNNQSKPIRIQGVSYTVFFNKLPYAYAERYCAQSNSRLADLQQHQQKEILILLRKQFQNCHITDLWSGNNGRKTPSCPTIHINTTNITNHYGKLCLRKFGFICQYGCPDFQNDKTHKYSIWTCKYTQKIKTCNIKCKGSTILVGTNSLLCNKNNWVTSSNIPVHFPNCLDVKDFENEFMNTFSKLKKEHNGFLFVFDKSSSGHEQNHEKQLDFMEVVLEVFPPSKYFPTGLILFDENVYVQIFYNETDICKVKEVLHHLKHGKQVFKSDSSLYFYKKPLIEAQKQIETIQFNKKTTIFFVTNHMNGGGSFANITKKLKRNHTIFSVGYGFDGIGERNTLASVASKNLLTYTFKNTKQLRSAMNLIKQHHGKKHKCKHPNNI